MTKETKPKKQESTAANTEASSVDADERDAVLIAGEVNRMIQVEVNNIYKRLERLRQQCRFPSFETVNIPMVLVLGNHSSGKSTFINHMLQQDVQKTGRAPTDCTFTVLVGGNREERLDGSALTRHAHYGFHDVERLFGRDFVSQIELKVVQNSRLLEQGGLMIVDSPGMIDPPGGTTSTRSDTDRGYDFKRVVHWLADRADVILVLFDPDKPGTTFETLDVLTTSLRDLSSKVLLILNKVDDFRTVHDFARAYGALCWNLSKVIPRKDLPFIYPMYVPREVKVATVTSPSSSRRQSIQEEPEASMDESVDLMQKMLEKEFDGTRGEVLREVERAPDRATDNILNLLKSTASRLQMHCRLVQACKQEYLDLKSFWKRAQVAGIVAGVSIAAFYIIRTVGATPVAAVDVEALADKSTASTSTASSTPSSSSAGSGAKNTAWKQSWAKQVARSQSRFRFVTLFKLVLSSCIGNVGIWKWSVLSLERKRQQILQWLPATFERVYASYLCKSDRTHDEIVARCQLVQPGLEVALSSTQIDQFPDVDAADTSYLEDVLKLHIPRLDRSVRDRTGDDHAYLRFKHLDKPSLQTQLDQA